MNADGVKVFHRTDGQNIAVTVAYNFKFNFFPAGNTFFNKNLVNGGAVQPVARNFFHLLAVFRNAAACSAERKRRTHNDGVADDVFCKIQRVFERRNNL